MRGSCGRVSRKQSPGRKENYGIGTGHLNGPKDRVRRLNTGERRHKGKVPISEGTWVRRTYCRTNWEWSKGRPQLSVRPQRDGSNDSTDSTKTVTVLSGGWSGLGSPTEEKLWLRGSILFKSKRSIGNLYYKPKTRFGDREGTIKVLFGVVSRTGMQRRDEDRRRKRLKTVT